MSKYILQIRRDKAGIILYCCGTGESFFPADSPHCQPYRFASKEDTWVHWEYLMNKYPEIREFIPLIEEVN